MMSQVVVAPPPGVGVAGGRVVREGGRGEREKRGREGEGGGSSETAGAMTITVSLVME